MIWIRRTKKEASEGEVIVAKNAGKDNEFLIITGTVHIGYGEDKQSVPFKSSYWSNVNGGGGTDFKWKDNTKGEYESVLVEFGDELLKFKKAVPVRFEIRNVSKRVPQ